MSDTQDEQTTDFLEQIFVGNQKHVEDYAEELEKHKDGQDPVTTTITCCDSRVMERNLVGNQKLGEDFTHEVIGNHAATYSSEGEMVVTGSIDYIPEHTDTYTAVLVIGHTGCGAVTATYDTLTQIEENEELEDLNLEEINLHDYNGETEGINTELKLIMQTGLVEDYKQIRGTGSDKQEEIDLLVEKNVDNQIDMLLEETDYEDTAVVGMVYDMTGNYGGEPGQLYLTNVQGATDVEEIENNLGEYHNINLDRLN